MFLYLLLLLIATVFGATPNCTTIARDDLLSCFSAHIDTDHSGNLSRAEVQAVTEPIFFNICDMNMDHVLGMDDWNHPVGCCKFNPCLYNICMKCVTLFNWTVA
ncbi:MAG: hypothetical protein K2Q45_06680 [Nitrosomonas sp.]|nr:hypothetical protein [Nitrosomonas sp.]